ncbi:MAG: HAD-IIB family hydrolase [Sulfuricurvum sp.]
MTFITDLDHTFLRSDLSISSFSKELWNRFAKDANMGIATARTYKKSMQFLGGLDLNLPMILLDGSLIATPDAKIIETKFIPRSTADEIIYEGSKFGIFPFLLSLADARLQERFSYSHTLNKHQKRVLENYKNDDHHDKQADLKAHADNFKIVYFGEELRLRDLHAHIYGIYGDSLKYVLAPEVYVGCYFLTILHKDADKSSGIKSVSKSAGFSLEDLTVFGDNHNDLGMFALAGSSVAVANAQDEVKEVASFVSSYTNNQDAVARYLADL